MTAWWRIVPRRRAADLYRRRFDSRAEAESVLALLKRRKTHKVVGYNEQGKRVGDPKKGTRADG